MKIENVLQHAQFNATKMAKVDLAQSSKLLCGLNCFSPGQIHQPHSHAGVDKLYHVLQGAGEFSLGDEIHLLTVGDLLHIPENVSHGVRNPGNAPLVVMVVMTPNPKG